jgi:hypothetical protein
MNKLAIFVEGMTEQVFVRRLIDEVAGKKAVAITSVKLAGQGAGLSSFAFVAAKTKGAGTVNRFALIVDCGGDSRVASAVRDHYEGLVKGGYTAIVGIRDVYPQFLKADVGKLKASMAAYQKTTPIAPLFVLATMEIEAWFISEHTHFARIHPRLTASRIVTDTGIDPRSDDTEDLAHPSVDIDRIYKLEGRAYRKSRKHIERTIGALDYAEVYLRLPARHQSVRELVAEIETFLS